VGPGELNPWVGDSPRVSPFKSVSGYSFPYSTLKIEVFVTLGGGGRLDLPYSSSITGVEGREKRFLEAGSISDTPKTS